MSKLNKNKTLLKLTKETPAARKARVSCGVKMRAAIFEDKKRRASNKKPSAQALAMEE